MVAPVLESLRAHVLDESEPLAGLLRKCVMLGAETRSEVLRVWARRELDGYNDDDDLPEYRRLGPLPVFVDSRSGPMFRTGEVVAYPQIPDSARQFIPEDMCLRQPIEELEGWAKREDSIKLTGGAMPAAAAVWSRQLEMFQEITAVYWRLDPTLIAGILGRARTTLVDFVAELTADAPLTELPSRERVDAAFASRIMHKGDVYNTTISSPTGPVAVGAKAKAKQGATVSDMLLLLGKVQAHAELIRDDGARQELLRAVDDLKEAASRDDVDAEEVKTKGERLKALGAKVGVGALAAATSGAAEAAMSLAVSGVFG